MRPNVIISFTASMLAVPTGSLTAERIPRERDAALTSVVAATVERAWPRIDEIDQYPTSRRALIGRSEAARTATVRSEYVSDTGMFRSGDAALSYVLDRPSGRGPFPLLVFTHGSGRMSKDELLIVVPDFIKRGFAVLRYDKRGVAQSGGQFRPVNVASSVTAITELAVDAAAALAFGCSAVSIDTNRCGFFGASQAGWVIPEAIMRAPRARFAILYSGVSVPIAMQMAFAGPISDAPVSLDSAYARIANFQKVEGYQPAQTLRALRVPTLWLLGMSDALVPNRVAAPELARLAREGVPVEVVTFEAYGHALGPDAWTPVDRFLGRVVGAP